MSKLPKKTYKHKIVIDIEYGSDFQAEVFAPFINAVLATLEMSMYQKHKSNKIEVKETKNFDA